MQLKKIKLAGFKSFVDPTTILLATPLVAVVGPNGCGKSNVIDAVCWVMGESSAKQLRGELLTDVIFNGSTVRKPVGQASVELIFDNQDGSLGGEYASYAEISIRRQIGRDAESVYYLNGARCRRRDVIDIFLGTGLGPRSYSIIGQNMISRIIEAKPDDMRMYLEEAAGVSRYKERRRETENRIQHTKENIARLDDIRLELDKQLGTLQRQANAAEKFKCLKQEELIIRGQWYAIQWRSLDMRLVNDSLHIQQSSTALEERLAARSSSLLQLEEKRQLEQSATQSSYEIQREFDDRGRDIARIEQDIHYQEERRSQLEGDIQRIEREVWTTQSQLSDARETMESVVLDIAILEPDLAKATTDVESAIETSEASEEMMQLTQSQWEQLTETSVKAQKTAEVEQTRIQHLERQIQSLKQRATQLNDEKSQLNFSGLAEDITRLSDELRQAESGARGYQQQLNAIREQRLASQQIERETNQQLDVLRNQLQQLRGQESSLQALQQTALGQRLSTVTPWLSEHQLDKNPRLAQEVTVESGWELAVERVLGAYLQAVCVETLADVIPRVAELKKGKIHFISKAASPSSGVNQSNALLSKVTSRWDLTHLLGDIVVADSLSDAIAQLPSLNHHESIITRDGVWLGGSWLQLTLDDSPETGIFQREQDLKELAQTIEARVNALQAVELQLSAIREQLKECDQQRDALQNTLNQSLAACSDIRASVKMKESQRTDWQSRADRLTREQDASCLQLSEAEAGLGEARSTWQNALSSLESTAKERDALAKKREMTREQWRAARATVDTAVDHAHQLEMRLKTQQAELVNLRQTSARYDAAAKTFSERIEVLQQELTALPATDSLKYALGNAITDRIAVEEKLKSSRIAISSIQNEIQALNAAQLLLEQDITVARDKLELLRIESTGTKVKADSLLEQLTEMRLTLEDALKDLPEEVDASEWQSNLESITQRIQRLGAINLVAIEEFATCSERKQYLDQQYNDLQMGLNTLEEAITKIDKETRAKFRETFDTVNNRFQELFPEVFAGGKAYLELVGDNVLDAGISVMACPPGKRNSSIHLLSGGEKAMTAIALIFSIFHLNPAPFCLLDEVDAPLDDANVGRFCKLVKSMSEKTQFIFISHNKLAIEMGQTLIGVTMHEPGVSRLVSVNIEEAISLAGVG